MHRHTRRTLLAALLAAAAPPLAGQGADTVRLRFGWQPGMEAEVEFEQVRIRDMDGRRDSTRIASTYRIQVSPHPEGLVVAYTDTRWTELPRIEGPAGKFFRALAGLQSGGKPEMVVTRAGEFGRIQGVEQMAAELRRAVRPLLDELEGSGADAVGDMLQTVLSPEGLAASAATEWIGLVGFWLDADLVPGQLYELEDVMESPLFPGVELPHVTEFEVVDRVPCREDETEPRCVALVASTFPDPDALREAVGEFLRRAGLPEAEMDEVLGQLSVETRATLVTEPGTLRPHALERVKLVHSGELGAPPAQSETETFRYRYPR